MMLQRFEQSLHRDALIPQGATVLCAVSGGADSVALLLLLHRLAASYPFTLQAAHLDHQLRPESGSDADFVAELCTRLDVPLRRDRVDVRALATERGEGLEAAGRFARRRFFEAVAGELGGALIALAHHADDQAETILFRLLRGTGVGGLAGMRPQHGPYIRPLLAFSRTELREWLQAQGAIWREDASNLDPAFSRNYLRHQLLPELQHFNPYLPEALCRLGTQAALEEDDWRQRIEAFLVAHLQADADGATVPAAALLALTPALRRRVVRELLARARGDVMRIDAVHLDLVDGLLSGARPQAEVHVPGVWVARRYERLLFAAQPPECPEFDFLVERPGDYPLPDGGRLRFELVDDAPEGGGPDVACFVAAAVPLPLRVRTVSPGDRFQPSGMDGHKRLKDFFVDARVDSERRRRTPLVFCGERLLWVAGLRRGEGDWPRPGEPVLKMSYQLAKNSR